MHNTKIADISDKSEIFNVVMTITDNAAIAEGGTIKAQCNGRSWIGVIENNKAKLYTSEVGDYTITVTSINGSVYTTILTVPYFGQYITDISSGTLVVTCTEARGNGKICNVRSCDDNYNFTDTYNRTQTFSTGLELTFLEIPSGKYLITVDGKYVFAKEITSIQYPVSAQVECKQWLYRNGNQCIWNTGGWIVCSVDGSQETYHGTTSNYTASVVFGEDKIYFKLSVYSPQSGSENSWHFPAVSANTNFGTLKPINITKYTKCIVPLTTSTNQLSKVFREGSINNSDTKVSSETVVASMNTATDNIPANVVSTEAYFVFGGKIAISRYENAPNTGRPSVGNYSRNLDQMISEIYLI